ncbi:flagellar FliL protein [Nocardioides sp. J9]|uniref:flagellar basal body-associated FliL family protein n=1 Tax=unclassified Nocardioides TaxID=2615069 RepID=UPI0004BA6D35|nr:MULTISPECIES: flagellar basal body-associated FliL family protein [unclassified Nocardioides]TWG98612.1 flagellar FliL protein [Nocardioides sp. J9]
MSATIAAPAPNQQDAEAPQGKGKKLVVVLLLLAVACGAGWWFFLKPAGSTEPEPGEVVPLEAIQVNLASGHYLRLGMALQLTDGAHEVDGSQALDAAIGVFSGLPVGEVNKPAKREALRHQLEEELDHRYHGDVMGVYFTEFVTQ